MWKVIIDGTSYQLAMPIEVVRQHNKDLDSAKVIIAHQGSAIELYTDMYVILTNNENEINDYSQNLFYSVMLINKFKETQINIFENIYNYEIELYSLTKLLELSTGDTTVSITQPRDTSRSSYTLADAIKSLENKVSSNNLIKVKTGTEIWDYAFRFKYDENMITEFESIKSPEFCFNSMTYREMLTSIMSYKNYIPKVENDFTISFLDMALKNVPEMDLTNSITSSSTRSLDSNDSADGFTINLQNVITESETNIDNITTTFEYVGFRNYTQPAISSALQNLEINTSSPIYRIKKFYIVGYWNMIPVSNIFIDKQTRWNRLDISELVMYGKERATLPYKPTSEEISAFESEYAIPQSINYRRKDVMNFLSQYQCYTFEYEQGGKKITGFTANIKELAYDIEIIKNVLDFFRSHRIISDYLNGSETFDELLCPQYRNMAIGGADDYYSRILFRVEYQPISKISFDVNKMVYNQKKYQKNVYDNQASALINAEVDGKNVYSKVERQGRPIHIIQSRVSDLSGIQPLPSKFGTEICYKIDMLIYDNFIDVAYFLQEKHLLLDYYNEVRSKARAWELAENYYDRQVRDKYYIVFSQRSMPDDTLPIKTSMITLARTLLDVDSYGAKYLGVEYALVNIGGVRFVVKELDKHLFGRCITLSYSFYDNVIAGVNIKNNVSEGFSVKGYVEDYIKYGDNDGKLSSVKTWFVSDLETWSAEDTSNWFPVLKDKEPIEMLSGNPVNWRNYSSIFQYSPLAYLPTNFIDIIGSKISYVETTTELDKDNKESISISTQFEYCTDDNNVVIYSELVKNCCLVKPRQNEDIFKELTYGGVLVIGVGQTISNVWSETTIGSRAVAYNENNSYYEIYEVEQILYNGNYNIYYNKVVSNMSDGDYVYLNNSRYIISNRTLVYDPPKNGLSTGYKIIATNQYLNEYVSKLSDIDGYVELNNSNYTFLAQDYDNVLGISFTFEPSAYTNLAIVDASGNLLLGFNYYNAGINNYYFNLVRSPDTKVYDSLSEVFASHKVGSEDYNYFE